MKNGRFLLNTNSKKVHDLKYADGRCKISNMKDSFKNYFDTFQEAIEYPDKEHPLAEFCSICEKNREKGKISVFLKEN